MPRISRYKLGKEELQSIQNHFSYLISSFTNSQEIENFFDGFLTPEEKLMLSKRLVLFMMIKRGYPPSVIQPSLHISYESVRTYTNLFSHKNELFQKTLDRLIKRDKTQEFWKKIDKVLKPVDLFLRAKTDMKARAKFASGDWE